MLSIESKSGRSSKPGEGRSKSCRDSRVDLFRRRKNVRCNCFGNVDVRSIVEGRSTDVSGGENEDGGRNADYIYTSISVCVYV